jgi:hypothetical protein
LKTPPELLKLIGGFAPFSGTPLPDESAFERQYAEGALWVRSGEPDPEVTLFLQQSSKANATAGSLTNSSGSSDGFHPSGYSSVLTTTKEGSGGLVGVGVGGFNETNGSQGINPTNPPGFGEYFPPDIKPPVSVRIDGVTARKIQTDHQALYYAPLTGELVFSNAKSGIRSALDLLGPKLTGDVTFQRMKADAGMPLETAGFVYVNLEQTGFNWWESVGTDTTLAPGQAASALKALFVYLEPATDGATVKGFLAIK